MDKVSDKHEILTELDMQSYIPNPAILSVIEEYCCANSLPYKRVKILDWGCGRGRFVLHMRRKGFQCYGVDTNSEPLENARKLYERDDIEVVKVLKKLDAKGQSDFPDQTFDIIISDQVLEHVENLEKTAGQMSRLTKTNGIGFHCFPARFGIIESHLHMPFVHWIPPGRFRKALIRLFVLSGIDPRWSTVDNSLGKREKADIYTDYLNTKTFYRPKKEILQMFSECGFSGRFAAQRSPRIGAIRRDVMRRCLGWLVTHFRTCYLSLRRRA